MPIQTIKKINAITRNSSQRALRLWTMTALLLGVVIVSSGLPAFGAESAGPNTTTVLPLKINAGDESASLTLEADQALYTAATALGFKSLPRSEVQQVVDYNQGSWPPALTTLSTLIPPDTDYVLIGSLTKTGGSVSIDMAVVDALAPTQSKYYFDEGKASDLASIFSRLTKNIQSYTNRQTRVDSLAISGNKKIESGAIIRKITLKAGDQYDAASLRQALKDIYKMGYFDNIVVQMTESATGKALVFEVTEKPVVGQIFINGEDELKEEKVREVVTVTPNNIISTQDVQKSADAIKQLYKDEGYYSTTVESETKTTKTGKEDVTFTIKEGHKVFIKEITLTGNTTFKSKTILKTLQTSKKGWFSWLTDSGILKRDLLAQDADRIVSYYNNMGFIDVKVSEAEITQKEKWLYINFNIAEGDRYRVGTLDLSGDLLEDKALLFGLCQITHEPYFSRKTLRDDVLKLTDRYAEKGYAFAEVIPATTKDEPNKRVNINLDIKKKELVHINRIVIKGNTRTRDKVIRREINVKESGLFNSVALKKSQEKLTRLEYFESVEINPVPTMDESLMDLQVEVKEKATGNFSIGAGYSSVDSFMFMSEISQNNFLGKGQRVALKANISGTSSQYNFNFTEPHLADSKLMFGFDLFNWMREYDNFTKDSQGFGLRFGYPIWRDWKMSTGYTLEDSTLSDVLATASQVIKDSMDINVTSALGLGFSLDTRDKLTDPSQGSLYTINSKYAGGFLGGDADFTKFEGSSSWFFKIPWDTVFHYKVAAGYTFANTTDMLPVYEKFYLGGMNSIRGFKSSSVSPRSPVTVDPDTGNLVGFDKIGGGKMWYTNTEWIFPLVKDAGLKGLLFFDCGNVYDVDEAWDFGAIKKSVGAGFRWLSPMGPLRLEWGYNLDPTTYEAQSNWDFSLGGSF